MQQVRPNINEILEYQLSRQLDGKTGLRRKRIETAGRQLRRCLEEVGEEVIAEASRSLVELERQFRADDAFGRILNAGDLLLVLRTYVREPWLLGDLRDRAVQLRLADALETLILKGHLATPQEFARVGTDIHMGIIKAKSDLTAERLRTMPR